MKYLLNEQRVGVIGYGHLGSALTEGWSIAGYDVMVNNKDLGRTREKLESSGTTRDKGRTLEGLADECQIINLAVRNSGLREIAEELDKHLSQDHIVLSFLAQESLGSVAKLLKRSDAEICKGMTTLGARNQLAVSAVQFEKSASYTVTGAITRLLESIGTVVELPSEEDMHAFTVAVGCFPGVLAYMLEQWEDAASQSGIDLSSNFPTLLHSSADLIEANGNLRSLRLAVTTKGGVTQAIVETMEQRGLSALVQAGMVAGRDRMQKGT